jgi:hypothetical protein
MTVPSARSQSEMYFARMTLTQREKRKIFLKMFSISKNSSLSTKLSGTWKKSDLLLRIDEKHGLQIAILDGQ